MNAVITAGGRVGGTFQQRIGVSVKALAPFARSTLLARTIDAVAHLGIERIAVVGGEEVAAAVGGRARVIPEAAGGAENLRLALRAWDDGETLLYLTSDMPFVDSQALQWFVRAAPPGAIALPLTEWAAFQARFPGAPPFGITLAGQKVVNGGAFLLPAGSARAIESFAARFFDARKSPLRMAALTGVPLLLQFLLRRLSIEALEAHAHRLIGIRARAVRGAPAELAYDVDTLEEYVYAVDRA
ncbi:MAG TPA: NTP transferase domain-containing protein [Candidatus Baltobacteraceae bacterium]|nr:NTP transferase domain-containing protein [Candidatus Baltobacteraceae bacterium]